MSVEIKKINPIECFVNSAEKIIERTQNILLNEIKSKAKFDLEKSVFPTLKTEEWKYTNLKKMLRNEFIHSAELDKVELSKSKIDKLIFNSFDSHLLVFINGVFEKELSDYSELQNQVTISSIAEAFENKNELVEKYFSKISANNSAFDYINLSNFFDGLFIHIPDNVVVEKPIQIINISGSTTFITH